MSAHGHNTTPRYIKPKLRAKRAKKQSRFLSLFAKVGRIYWVCRKLRSTPGNHYFWLRTDPDYKQRFDAVQHAVARPSYKHPAAVIRNAERRRPRQRTFLNALQRFHQFGPAAKAANITRSTHDRWLRVDLWYAREFKAIKRRILSGSERVRLPFKKKIVPIPVGLGSVAERREEVSRLKAARKLGHGSIKIFTRSNAIIWFEVQIASQSGKGRRRYENVGPISVEATNEILKKRTAADQRKRQRAREVVKDFLRSTAKLPDEIRKADMCASLLKPRQWCEARDRIDIPMTDFARRYGKAWVAAYDSKEPDFRQYLSIKQAQKRKAARLEGLTPTAIDHL